MNDEFIRMKELLEKTGLSFEEGGISFAELAAYAKGIEYARNMIEKAETSVFITGEDIGNLIRYADLLKLDAERFEFEGLKNEIIRRFSLDYGKTDWNLFRSEFLLIGSGSYSFDVYEIIFSGVKLEDLKELGKFIEAYMPFFYKTSYSGSGLTFDLWDGIGYSFNRYDGLNLPFDIIDNLRSDEIEQHE